MTHLDSEQHVPDLSVAILGADATRSQTVARKLHRTIGKFLAADMTLDRTIQKMQPLRATWRREFQLKVDQSGVGISATDCRCSRSVCRSRGTTAPGSCQEATPGVVNCLRLEPPSAVAGATGDLRCRSSLAGSCTLPKHGFSFHRN